MRRVGEFRAQNMKILEGRDRHALFTTGVWALMCLLLLRQVVVYGTRVPFNDDWILLRMLRPDVPLHGPELWWVHNEHRIPLAKLLWLATVGGLADIRAGTWLTALLMAGSAWLCMRAARRLRGRTHFTDAFFPLVLLHGAQCENTLNSFQLSFSIPAALTVLGLVLIATSDERPNTSRVAAVAGVALAMPLTGGVGLPHALAWGAWLVLVWRAARRTRETAVRWTGRVALAATVLLALLVAWYFVDYHLLPGFRAPDPPFILATALQFLARGFGEPARLFAPLGTWVVIGVALWTAVVLGWAWFESDTARARALGLAVVLAAVCGTALAVGYGRAMDGEGAGLLERYGIVSAPFLCACALAASLAWERRFARGLAWALFGLAASCWLPNFLAGEREGLDRRTKARALEADLAAGNSLAEIAARRWRDFYYSAEGFESVLRDFEATGLMPARGQAPGGIGERPGPPFQVFWTRPLGGGTRDDVQVRRSGGEQVLLVRDHTALEFALGSEPTHVRARFGVHAELVALGMAPPVRFSVDLRRADATTARLFERTLDPTRVPADAGEQELLVALDATAAGGIVVLRVEHAGQPERPWAGFWRDVLVQ